VTRLSLAHRHDPYWDLDGSGARRSRHQRQFVRMGVRIVAILAIAFLVTRMPAVDPSILTRPEGRPILAAAIHSLLAAFTLLALAKIRSGDSN
jgi:hypothetical protein